MIIIAMGVSGSGKSTYGFRIAEALGLPFIEGDAYHPATNVAKMSQGIPLDDEDRRPWLERLALVLAEAERNAGCVLACSALKASYRELLGSRLSAKPIFVLLDGSREILTERLSNRQGHFFPATLLDSQLDTLERPAGGIVVDIEDPVEEGVAEILKQIKAKTDDAGQF